jgi:hypothetical protein
MNKVCNSLLLLGVLWLPSCGARHEIERHEEQGQPAVVTESFHDSENPSSRGLSVRLEMPSEVPAIDKPIVAVLVIENRDDFYWTFFPAYAPKGHVPEDYPVAELEFLIRNDVGSYLEWNGNYEGLREPPSLCSALILMPGSFVGYRISMTEGDFSYQLIDPGTYRVKARLRFDQSSWVETMMKQRKSNSADIPYDTRRVFNGVLESNEVSVTITRGR